MYGVDGGQETANEDIDTQLETTCREQLNQLVASHRDVALENHDMIARRLFAGEEDILMGKPEGRTAGIIHAVANLNRRACAARGLLNSEFEAFFTVSMGTVYRRAAQAVEQTCV